MATSMPASASSPASINPVGPPPTIITEWSRIAFSPPRFARAAMLHHRPGLTGRPRVIYILKRGDAVLFRPAVSIRGHAARCHPAYQPLHQRAIPPLLLHFEQERPLG